jgi:hypothetical protein
MIPDMVWGQIGGAFSILLYESGMVKDSIITDAGKIIALQVSAVTDFPISGKVKYLVQGGTHQKFRINFSIPSWADQFRISVNGKEQKLKNERGYFPVDRVWGKADEVIVQFKMPLQVIDGGISYPGAIGFKRGPQVLSWDSSLNTFNPTLPVKNGTSSFTISAAEKVLPANWIGKQAYRISSINEPMFLLVPFADAGQTSAEQKVWLFNSNNNKK